MPEVTIRSYAHLNSMSQMNSENEDIRKLCVDAIHL